METRATPGDVRGLMLALASLLTIVSAMPPGTPLPPHGIGRRLRKSTYLGRDGIALLLLRDVESGARWHDDAQLHERARSHDGLPLPVRPIECPLLPAEPLDRLDPDRRAAADALRQWWQRSRERGAPLRGVVDQAGEHYWVASDGGHVLASRKLSDRVAQIPGLRRPHGDARGRARPDVVAAWTAYRDDEQGRLAIDVLTEPDGLCTGALLLQAGADSLAGAPAFFDAVIASAWDVARIAVRQYWILWDRVHGRHFIDAINDRAAVDRDPAHRHDALLKQVAGNVQHLLRAIAHAFQTPSVAFLAPDTAGDIGIISHVGYLDPTKPFRLSPRYRGLGHLFCLRVDAVGRGQRRGAYQIASIAEMERAYRDFDLPGEGAGRAAGAASPRSEIEERLQPELYDPREGGEGCPRALEGPWAYADVSLPKVFWSEPAPEGAPLKSAMKAYGTKLRPGGVLKIQGRIRSELDAPGAGPPRLSPTELRRLHQWARTVAVVFERLLLANERNMAHGIVEDAVPQLLEQDLSGFADFLVRKLDAAGVAFFLEREGSYSTLHQRWNARIRGTTLEGQHRVADALRRGLLRDAHGETVVGKEKDFRRGFVEWGPGEPPRLNCTWVPIGGMGALAVIGAPPELPAFGHVDAASDSAWLAERSRAFPRFLDAMLTMLRDLLLVRLHAVAEDSAGGASPSTKPSHLLTLQPLAALWNEVYDRWSRAPRVAVPGGDATPTADGSELARWLSRARATWKKEELARMLGTSVPTLDRRLERLYDDGVVSGSWKDLGRGNPFASEQEAAAELEKIGGRRSPSSLLPPPVPSSRGVPRA